MRSLLVEFHRFKNLELGMLREGDDYLIAAASHPVREFKMLLDHVNFLDHVQALRYGKSAEERLAALKCLGEAVTQFLGTDSLSDISRGEFPLQLDLVVNPAELAALPFEAAIDAEGQPLFARGQQAVVLTRRVRHDFAENHRLWPPRPRILYAWASPSASVPSAEHESALRAALEPWLPVELGIGTRPESGDALTILPHVSLATLAVECQRAVEAGKPYTHVHLLAHGSPVDPAHRQRFGIALHADENAELETVVEPEQLEQALAPLAPHTFVVTLATCDAANSTNTLIPKRSIAHGLHTAGFPIVVASQFPLTVPGSTVMVQAFYNALLAGKDVREALHQTRMALYECQQTTGHDWVSLVGYVELPEGYPDHLTRVQLESMLASLKTMQGCSDTLLQSGCQDPVLFSRVEQQLRHRINTLQRFLEDPDPQKSGRRGLLEENLGLLGSAEKRLAELLHRGPGGASRVDAVKAALQRACDWYMKGFQHNSSSHWNGVQYLSLEAILKGSIEPRHWFAAVTAAEFDSERPTELWALGSLIEIYLLGPFAGQRACIDLARQALLTMKDRARTAEDDTFPLESTGRQLRRYVDWWTNANGFFPGASDVAAQAKEMLEEIERRV
jgi:hypothetical protein